jgi:hypothetical protein
MSDAHAPQQNFGCDKIRMHQFLPIERDSKIAILFMKLQRTAVGCRRGIQYDGWFHIDIETTRRRWQSDIDKQ